MNLMGMALRAPASFTAPLLGVAVDGDIAVALAEWKQISPDPIRTHPAAERRVLSCAKPPPCLPTGG